MSSMYGLLADLIDALDPLAEIELRRALCREADQRGYRRGHADGREEMAAEMAAAWNKIASAVVRRATAG